MRTSLSRETARTGADGDGPAQLSTTFPSRAARLMLTTETFTAAAELRYAWTLGKHPPGALARRNEAGEQGKKILGPDLIFDLLIPQGRRRYGRREESALMESRRANAGIRASNLPSNPASWAYYG